jgi:hypothetical protein
MSILFLECVLQAPRCTFFSLSYLSLMLACHRCSALRCRIDQVEDEPLPEPEIVDGHGGGVPVVPPEGAGDVVVVEGDGGGGGKGGGKGKHKGPVWPSWDIIDSDGTFLGCIKYGVKDGILSAHCLYTEPGANDCRHGLCRANRTVKGCGDDGGSRPWQGRPVGFLVAWLRHSRDMLCHSRGIHKGCLNTITEDERESARTLVEYSPRFSAILNFERDLRPGEPREHPFFS